MTRRLIMKKILILSILTLFFAVSAFAQETKNNPVEWVRVENETGEFSVEMPSNFTYFYDRDGFNYDNSVNIYQFAHMQMLNAAADKTVMSVEMYQVKSPKSYLAELVERHRTGGAKSDESKDGFTIKQFTQTTYEQLRTQKQTEIHFVTRFIASKTRLYVVTVANRGAQTESSKRFLASIRLNQKNSSDTTKIVSLSNLKPITIEQIGYTVKEDDKPKDNIQTDKLIEKPEIPTIILSKPFASYTNEARQALVSGTIRLLVTFEKDGRISKIGVVKDLPNGLTRNAFFAALRVKFLPQEKQGELETTRKTIEYSFSVG
jgi:hypothetical protein